MILLGIDPGPTTSGVCVYDATSAPFVVASHARLRWHDAREWLRAYPNALVICERTQAGPPSTQVVLTTEIVGRVQEACDLLGHQLVLKYRREVLQALGCAAAGNKDALVRQVLIGMHGGDGLTAVGHKKRRGPLWGVSSHSWQALALCVAHRLQSGATYERS